MRPDRETKGKNTRNTAGEHSPYLNNHFARDK